MKYYARKYLLVLMTAAIGLGLGSQVTAEVMLAEDFEAYDLGTWPSSWVPDANANDSGNNYVAQDPLDSGNKTLRLFGSMGGCWAALAYHPISFTAEFTVETRIYNGSETLTGCHPDRGGIVMRHGTYWYGRTNPSRRLIQFRGDGAVRATGATILGTYETDRWYDVKVHYYREGTDLSLRYWVDGDDFGEVHVTIEDLEKELSFDHFELSVQEGSAYFDDLEVTEGSAPIPEPATLGLIGLGLIPLIRRRRR